MSTSHLTTKLCRAGEHELAKEIAESVSVPKVIPIYMSSVFSFDDVPTLDSVYEGKKSGYVYSRMANPGLDAAQDVLRAAEGSDRAIVFSAGMAAIITTIMSNVKSGDHIVSSPVLYGGVYDYFANELPRWGVTVDFVDFDTEDIEAHIKPNTKLIYTETIANPLMEVTDIRKAAAAAHAHGCKLVVDNTFATPVVCRPLELGADIVVYSATKYLGGHSDFTGGAVCAGAADIANIQKYATLYGDLLSPFDSFLLTRSMRTLELRVRQHSENALKVAQFLEHHPKVEKVYYAGLESSPYHDRAVSQFTDGMCGGMVSADIAGGAKGAEDFIAACQYIKFVPSLASFSTTLSYPVKTSHRAYPPEELKKCGISASMIRFSIGIEHADDIIADMDQALSKI